MTILIILFFLFAQIADADDSSSDDSSELPAQVSIAGESSLESKSQLPESTELSSSEESIKDFVHSVFRAITRGSDQPSTSYHYTSEITQTPGFGWVDIGAGARSLVSAAPSPAPLAPVPQGIPKTRLCRHWSEGRECPLGDGCGFAHGPDELVEVGDRHPGYRIQPCVVFHTRGNCEFGDKCHFRH